MLERNYVQIYKTVTAIIILKNNFWQIKLIHIA